MRIQSLPSPAPRISSLPASPPKAPLAPEDHLETSPPPATPAQVGGALGAMAGALLVGRPLASLAVAAGSAALAGSLLGPVGAVVGGLAGLYGGIRLELKTRAGRLLGGMAGAAIGSAVGKVAGWMGARPGQTLAQECKGFSLRSLPSKLLNPHYTSHPKCSPEIAAEGAALTRPGDLIITNDDGNFMLELIQKGIGLASSGYGVRADWTHIYMVDHDHKVLDILLDGNGPTRFPLEHAFTDNCHAKILRPRYSSPEARQRTLDNMNNQFGKIAYDDSFDFKTDDRQYCLEYVGKALMKEDPGLGLETSRILGRKTWEYLTPDNFDQNPNFEEIYSTGSNFWLNWLSHFT